MRILVTFLLLITILQSGMTQTSQFKLNLKIIQKERSKDSNLSVETFSIQGYNLQYGLVYSGRRKTEKNVKKQIQISQENIEEIKALLESNNLYQSIVAPKRSEFTPPYVATEVSLTMNKNQEAYSIQLYDLSEKLRQDETFKNINHLRRLLKRYLE